MGAKHEILHDLGSDVHSVDALRRDKPHRRAACYSGLGEDRRSCDRATHG